jgi:hypothetical protein
MAKHALVFVHGMGEYKDGWHTTAMTVLSTAFSEYEAFKNTPFTELVEAVPTNYSTLFTELRAQWKNEVGAIKTTLGQQLEAIDKAERAKVEKEIDNVADKIGAGADTFAWTHAMDVVLYRFFALTRHAVNVDLAQQIMAKATKMPSEGWSLIAHSLGTAVTHNTLHALYTTQLVPGQPPLKPMETRPKVLAMVANVSRVTQLPDLKVFNSKVCPGSALLDRACQIYLNVRHQWDPFTIPQPFIPDAGWPDVVTFHSSQYQHIRPSHLRLKKYMDVHDLDHYLINPRVHVPIFRGIFGDGVIPDAELALACEKFDAGVVVANTNDIRDELDKLLPAAADQWPKLLMLIFKLFAKGAV